MIGTEDDRVALEELVGPAGGLDQGPDRRVAPLQRLLRHPRPGRMRGEIVIGQVVDEEVEAVSRDQPAADRCGVRVDRSACTTEHRERRAGHIRLEQIEEEEALRPVGRAAGHGRHG